MPSRSSGAFSSARRCSVLWAQAGDVDLASLAADLIESGATTRPVETVITVLSSHIGGASINAAAKASGINYSTAQRIVQAAAAHRQRPLAALG